MAIKGVIPKSKAEQLAAANENKALADARANPVPYSEEPADLAAALVALGIMAPDEE